MEIKDSMKTRSILLRSLPLLLAVLLFSCAKKEDAPVAIEKPTLTINELGAKNSKVAYPGHDLHIDADISAPGKIRNIKLQITLTKTDFGWDFVKTYTTGYAGAKNANFHQHVDVPENARPGIYTLLLIATDEMGEKAREKVDFEVKRDAALPTITGLALTPKPSALHLSGTITAANKIEKLVVEVQSATWTREFEYTDEPMVGRTSFSLDRDIDISDAPNGHYHVNITIIDQAGKRMGYHDHFDKN